MKMITRNHIVAQRRFALIAGVNGVPMSICGHLKVE